MRAALSILGLVIVLALVLNQVKKQAGSLSRPGSTAAAASAASDAAATQNLPAAVRQQLQDAADQAAQRASAAQP